MTLVTIALLSTQLIAKWPALLPFFSANDLIFCAIASDSWITTEVKSKLIADKQTSGTAIHVNTYEGVVTLTGKAKSQEEANRAVEDAKAIKGVKSVQNNLEVSDASQAQK